MGNAVEPARLQHGDAWHDLDALHRAVNDIRDFKSHVAALHKEFDGKSQAAAVLAEGDAVAAKASTIEGALMQVKITGSEGNLNFPDMLNEQLYAFASFLEDADTAPTRQESEMYAALHSQLEDQLKAWATLKNGEVAAFQSRAKQLGE
jgi:hypothetical protein